MFFNAHSKNKDKSYIFLKTQAKNIFDKNGINLDAYLDIFSSELNKRDIKRIYFDLSDLDLPNTATTFDILSAMQDNTLALLSIENNSPLVNEIGSRIGGTMLLFKKTSVYFSGGIFIAYRYGEVFHGFPGLAGNSFEWSISQKTIHSYHNGSSSALTKINSYEKITGWGGNAINPRLINDNDSFIIPSGVHKIMISATVVIESLQAGQKFIQIFKNGATTDLSVKQTGYESSNLTLSITPLILEVNQGDYIDLRVYSNSLDTLRFKHLTIEILN